CDRINRYCFRDGFHSRYFCNHARSIPCFLLKYFGLDWDPLAIFCRRRFHAELLFSALRLRFHSSDARNEDAAQPRRTGANRTFARPYHFYSPVVRDHFTTAAAQSRSEADLWPGRAAWSDSLSPAARDRKHDGPRRSACGRSDAPAKFGSRHSAKLALEGERAAASRDALFPLSDCGGRRSKTAWHFARDGSRAGRYPAGTRRSAAQRAGTFRPRTARGFVPNRNGLPVSPSL